MFGYNKFRKEKKKNKSGFRYAGMLRLIPIFLQGGNTITKTNKNLYWIQCGSCGGDSMSLLNLDSPDLPELLANLGINVLWHPSLSQGSPNDHQQILDKLISGEEKLDILCVEGNVIRGPDGSGMFDTFSGRPKMRILEALAHQADVVIAVGTCAAFGGIGASSETEATGLQYHRWEKGGFLGEDFVAKSGLPVINLSGCPCHCDIVAGVLTQLINNVPVELSKHTNEPLPWYGMTVHQGCTRNEYHEYRVEEEQFGELGCMFFYMGCKGPTTNAACNKILWNGVNSKTRAGVPCFGCTRPDFPQSTPFFKTRNIEGTPLDLPSGVDRAHYLAYKGMAAAATPARLTERKPKV